VRKRIQLSGTQNRYDNLIEIVNNKYINKSIYSECKDCTSELNYTDAMIKLPQIASSHDKVDLVLFISPLHHRHLYSLTKKNILLDGI